jgi:hypothetical protein
VTALAAYETARILAAHGLDSDTATTADIDTAADHAGVQRPAGSDDRHTVRAALDAIGETR